MLTRERIKEIHETGICSKEELVELAELFFIKQSIEWLDEVWFSLGGT